MKFKSKHKNLIVWIEGDAIMFKNGMYITDDKKLGAKILKAVSVEEIKEPKESKKVDDK